ncbi:MAG: hypothetical protein M1272_05340 [Firmicutes bacterium]|nr:hypothetical protein [Bacillota bacterium]
MSWNRRTVVTSSAATTAALALMAAIIVMRLNANGPASGPAWSMSASLAGPVWGSHGRVMTRQVTRPALLVVPAELSASLKSRLARAMGSPLGTENILWMAGAGPQRYWTGKHLKGISPVRAAVWVPRIGASSSLIMMAARSSGAVSRGPWTWRRGAYRLSGSAKSVHTTVNASLTQSLAPLVAPGGAVFVVGRQGALLAGVGAPSGQGALWRPEPAGMAVLPPLLGLALQRNAVYQALDGGQSTLSAIAAAWGEKGLSESVAALGFGSSKVGAMTLAAPRVSSPLSANALEQGQGLSPTPLEVARSYLPFLDQGRFPPLAVSTDSRPARIRAIAAKSALSQVLSQLPQVKVGSMVFRVWRPQGLYAVVLAPRVGVEAVLEGPATRNTMAALAILAAQRP